MNDKIFADKDRKEIQRGQQMRDDLEIRQYLASMMAQPPMPGMPGMEQAGGMMPPQMNAPMQTLGQQGPSPWMDASEVPWQAQAQMGMGDQEREEWRMQQLLKQILISQMTGEPMPPMATPAVDYPNAPQGSMMTPMGMMPPMQRPGSMRPEEMWRME